MKTDPIPPNQYGLEAGCLLLPGQDTQDENYETVSHFMQAIGGDGETYICVLGMQDGVVIGCPLGATPFTPPFMPTWDLQQLCDEIQRGCWRIIKNGNPEYQSEVERRWKAAINFVADKS